MEARAAAHIDAFAIAPRCSNHLLSSPAIGVSVGRGVTVSGLWLVQGCRLLSRRWISGSQVISFDRPNVGKHRGNQRKQSRSRSRGLFLAKGEGWDGLWGGDGFVVWAGVLITDNICRQKLSGQDFIHMGIVLQ